MKKIIYLCFFVLAMQIYGTAQETPWQITTKFDSPFQKLTLHPAWQLDEEFYDINKNIMFFDYRDSHDINFTISSIDQKAKMNIEKLYKQIDEEHGLLDSISLSNYSLVKVNGLKCIKAYYYEIFPINRKGPQWHLCYVFIVHKRLYVFDFEAPYTKFPLYEAFFDATLESLF